MSLIIIAMAILAGKLKRVSPVFLASAILLSREARRQERMHTVSEFPYRRKMLETAVIAWYSVRHGQ